MNLRKLINFKLHFSWTTKVKKNGKTKRFVGDTLKVFTLRQHCVILAQVTNSLTNKSV